MRRIKKVLFANCEPGIIDELAGQLTQTVREDQVLKLAGVEVRKSLIEGSEYGLNITDPGVYANVEWADLILVSGLLEENKLCVSFDQARSITLTLSSLLRPGEPWKDNYCNIDQLLPVIIGLIKDSYSNALLAKGTSVSKGTVVGTALVAKKMADLLGFRDGQILVMDRPGWVIYSECDDETAAALTKKFSMPRAITPSKEKSLQSFNEKLGFQEMTPMPNLLSNQQSPEPSPHTLATHQIGGYGAFQAALNRSSAAIFSHGRHGGESAGWSCGIPCISRCVGATDAIKSGQSIIVDADRGEIYDYSQSW
ncbi:hypothetical protein DGWBC_0631 [Dehalogenimonas sp. WBC-2]|nr:hypothetical protein DGWBC_0631 [Dehalogenimonas sp. WBC-2]